MVNSREFFSKIRVFAFVLAIACVAVSLGFMPISKVDASINDGDPVISDNYLRGVKEGLSCAELQNYYTNAMHGCDYYLYTKTGEYISTSHVKHVVCTGDYILDARDNKYFVVVTGDIDGDGEVKLNDTAIIKMHFATTIELQNEFYAAADSNNDNRVTATDYLRIKYHIQSKFNIHDNESFSPDDQNSVAPPDYDESNWTSGWM